MIKEKIVSARELSKLLMEDKIIRNQQPEVKKSRAGKVIIFEKRKISK